MTLWVIGILIRPSDPWRTIGSLTALAEGSLKYPCCMKLWGLHELDKNELTMLNSALKVSPPRMTHSP
jgi:hypothetical protein